MQSLRTECKEKLVSEQDLRRGRPEEKEEQGRNEEGQQGQLGEELFRQGRVCEDKVSQQEGRQRNEGWENCDGHRATAIRQTTINDMDREESGRIMTETVHRERTEKGMMMKTRQASYQKMTLEVRGNKTK